MFANLKVKEYNEKVNANLTSLQRQIILLNDILDSVHGIRATCYQVPKLTLQDEKDGLIHRPIHIERSSSDFLALTSIKKTFKDFLSQRETSTKSTARLPGFIHIKDASVFADIQASVLAINDCKATFKSLIQVKSEDIAPDFNLEEYFLNHHSFLVKTQVTRHLRLVSPPTDFSIGFHWSNKPLSDVVTKESVKSKIEARLEKLEHASSLSSNSLIKIEALNIALKKVEGLSDNACLRIRRLIPTQPCVNLRISKNFEKQKGTLLGESYPMNFSCPIPFIICSTYDIKKIAELSDYTTKNRDKTLSGQGRYTCFDAPMNLYLRL